MTLATTTGSTLGSTPAFRCPVCRGALGVGVETWTCEGCGAPYLVVDGIPVLFADAPGIVEEWGARLGEFAREIRETRDKILAQLVASPDLHPRTRRRLEQVYAGMQTQQERVSSLFAAAGIEARAEAPREFEGVPGEGGTMSYFHQIHRDWSWDEAGSTENADALQVVLDVAAECRPRRMLVLGAGAARLPLDVHRALGVEHTVAVDINPLPFLVARRLLGGEALKLLEFPISPRDSESAVVERTLKPPQNGAAGFTFVFADGLDLPVPDGAFDAVFTPWFIDQVPKDLATSIPEIHRVLAPEGVWINHGPLLFHPSHTMLAHRYRTDEVLELVAEHGFDVLRDRWDRMLYMQSPAGSQGRTEGVLSFAARARTRQASSSGGSAQPAWLHDLSVPVERWPELHDYQAPHPMFSAVAGLIDGHRSTAAIALIMVQRFSLPPDAAEGGVQACLAEMWRARRSK